MDTIELIYDADCPNVKDARAQLLRALAEVGLPPRWREWDRGDPESPPHVRDYGSPTILVGGKDVAGASPSDGADCCRLYVGRSSQFQGVPSVEMIASALRSSISRSDSGNRRKQTSSWRSGLAAVPGIGLALLPKIACPACWPAYAGLLSSLGIGFLMDVAYLLPLTLLFLAVAVGALGFRARRRRGYGPFAVGTLASVFVIVGKFVLGSNPVTYGGTVLLIAASLWNSWPRKSPDSPLCPACAPAGPLDETWNIESARKEV